MHKAKSFEQWLLERFPSQSLEDVAYDYSGQWLVVDDSNEPTIALRGEAVGLSEAWANAIAGALNSVDQPEQVR